MLSLPNVHRLDGITANPDHTISLSLAGVVPGVFAPYYDIYPIEASSKEAGTLARRETFMGPQSLRLHFKLE